VSAASSAYSGLWTILSAGGRLNAVAANVLGTGWVDVLSGGSLGLLNSASTLTGSGIVVRAGASLSLEGDSTATIRMQGGTFGTLAAISGYYTLGGSIYVDAPSTFQTPGSDGKWITVNSTLYGTGGIVVTNFAGAPNSYFDLTVDSSGTYTGAWTVVGGQLKGSAANAFGAGTVTATTGALVRVGASQTAPVFTMGTGSVFNAEWGGTATIGSLHVAGATIGSDLNSKTLAGSIYVDGPSTLRGYGSDAGRTFTISAPFYGSQPMTFNHTGGAPGPVYITGNSGSTFSGGWTVSNGTLQLQNALGLGDGTGPLTIAAAGPKLYYEAAYTVTNSALTLGTDTFADGTYSITNTYVSRQANSVAFTNFFTRKAGVNDGWVVVKGLPSGTVFKFR
jgi:fibronectin-binding autotransporter adhesin